MRISLLININHPQQSNPTHYAQRRRFFSKTSWKTPISLPKCLVWPWSGRPVLTYGKRRKFQKRKRKSPSYVHVLHKTWNWEVSRRSRTTIDGKEMNKVLVLLIKVIAFLPFSLPSPSSFLKLPNVSSSPLKKVLWNHRSPKAYFRKFSLSAGVQNSGNVF